MPIARHLFIHIMTANIKPLFKLQYLAVCKNCAKLWRRYLHTHFKLIHLWANCEVVLFYLKVREMEGKKGFWFSTNGNYWNRMRCAVIVARCFIETKENCLFGDFFNVTETYLWNHTRIKSYFLLSRLQKKEDFSTQKAYHISSFNFSC